MKKAVVLLSGGIDSSTTLYWALKRGYKCFCLIFDYGQRHRKELDSAKRIARLSGSSYQIAKIHLPYKDSSLLDKKRKLPRNVKTCIPSTYVPGRNIIFLSIAVGFAEAMGARDIFFGANIVDYSGYPDCRPGFIKRFQSAINAGTKAGLKSRFRIRVPFLRHTKAQIIRTAQRLKVPLQYTWSCYTSNKRPCGRCPSCLIRRRGFKELGLKDPLER